MSITDTHNVVLRFRLDSDAPQKYIDKWKKLKSICENDEKKISEIVVEWLQKCKKQSNKKLPVLKRSEGGIGGNDNTKNKQIRFREIYDNTLKDNDIVLDQVYNTKKEKWTLDELDDLVYGFEEYANEYMDEECVRGVIEIKKKSKSYNKKLSDSNSSDSDSSDSDSSDSDSSDSDSSDSDSSDSDSSDSDSVFTESKNKYGDPTSYILEVQRFHSKDDLKSKKCHSFEHVGYMNLVFKSKEKACAYYDKYKKGNRSLNAHGTWCSDWDPKNNNYRYIVRSYNGEYLSIDPFDKKDKPKIKIFKNKKGKIIGEETIFPKNI